MKNRIPAMLCLTALIALGCEEAQLSKSNRNQMSDPSSQNIKELTGLRCYFADAAVEQIAIHNVINNTFDFTFRVTNQGMDSLYLNRMYFQPYLSEDGLFDSGDLPFRGSLFGDSAPALAAGEKYVQSWFYHSTTPVNLNKYNYLIIQVALRPTFSMQECTLVNNVAVSNLGCVLSDAAVSHVSITDINTSANTFRYTLTVTNTGWVPLPLSQMGFQTYVSRDTVLGTDDMAGGGAGFTSNAPTLAKGESYLFQWYYSPSTPENLAVYQYLIIQLSPTVGPVPECNTDNNTTVTLIATDNP